MFVCFLLLFYILCKHNYTSIPTLLDYIIIIMFVAIKNCIIGIIFTYIL